MNIEEAAAEYLRGVPLREVAKRFKRSHTTLGPELRAYIGDEAFQSQASENRRIGNKRRFNPDSVDVDALVRGWKRGRTLVDLRKEFRIPTARHAAMLIIKRIGAREYRNDVKERCGRAGRRAWSNVEGEAYGCDHPIFRMPWGVRG